MSLHILKLCVGVDTAEELAAWQAKKLKAMRARNPKARLMHVTRMTPKRRDDILDGGSIYWVMKGFITVRQRILDLAPVQDGGIPHCGIVLDPKLVPVQRRAHRPFQGWRYFDPALAPGDLSRAALELPPDLQKTLAELGLL